MTSPRDNEWFIGRKSCYYLNKKEGNKYGEWGTDKSTLKCIL